MPRYFHFSTTVWNRASIMSFISGMGAVCRKLLYNGWGLGLAECNYSKELLSVRNKLHIPWLYSDVSLDVESCLTLSA